MSCVTQNSDFHQNKPVLTFFNFFTLHIKNYFTGFIRSIGIL